METRRFDSLVTILKTRTGGASTLIATQCLEEHLRSISADCRLGKRMRHVSLYGLWCQSHNAGDGRMTRQTSLTVGLAFWSCLSFTSSLGSQAMLARFCFALKEGANMYTLILCLLSKGLSQAPYSPIQKAFREGFMSRKMRSHKRYVPRTLWILLTTSLSHCA